MGRRKRVQARRPPANAMLERLKRAIRTMDLNRIGLSNDQLLDDDGDMIPKVLGSDPAAGNLGLQRAKQVAAASSHRARKLGFPGEYDRPADLASRFEDLQTMYPASVSRQPKPLDAKLFQIKQVFKDGVIVAECSDPQEPCQLYIDTELSKRIPAGCSCEASDGEAPCKHSYSLLSVLAAEVRSPKSVLWQRIQSRQFDQDKPPQSTFRYDSSRKVLGWLKGLCDQAPPHVPSVAPDSLAPLMTLPAQRLAWNLSTRYSGRLEPVVQQLSKKGDRWLKPKALSRDDFAGMSDLPPLDQKLRAMTKTTYYEYDLPLLTALPLLQGDERFHINGSLGTIKICEPSLQLKRIGDRWEFVCPAIESKGKLDEDIDDDDFIDDDDDEFRQLLLNNDGMVWLRGKSTVCVMPFKVGERKLFRDLLEMEPVSRQYETQLFEHCGRLAHRIPIQMPAEAKHAPLPQATYRPAILMRSNADGSLSYGWRVRSEGDVLLVPGDGPRVLGDQPPQQWQRAFSNELHLVQTQAARLNLPPDQIHGAVADFAQAMDLITALQADDVAIEVLWDSQSTAPVSYVGAITPGNLKVSIDRKRDWFQLNGMCQLGDRQFKLKDIIDAVSSDESEVRGQYIRIGKGDWAKLSDELRLNLKRLNRAVNVERGSLNFDHTSAPEMRELQRQLPIEVHKAWDECLQRLKRSEQLDPVPPAELQASLREYQVDGFKWMRRLAEWGVGGVLADDMGLGKTVQTIAVLIDRAAMGPSLVVAPTSVGFNWQRELQRFAPNLKSHLYRETDRGEFLNQLGPGDVVVCSYGLVLRDSEKLKEISWGSLVLDEAQAIKNARSKTAMAITELNAAWTVALTGTPVENHLGELWSLFRAVSPGVLGSWEQFRKRFAAPIERGADEACKQALRSRLRPFVLRRTKGEVLQDLPARTESSLTVELSPQERKLYDQTRLQVLSEAQEIAMLPDTNDQRFKILALITRLRQIACHPGLVDKTWKQRSSKLQLLAETVTDLKSEGHRVLVFSQFVQHLQLIREMLDEEQVSYQYLDGTTPAAKRQEQVDQFQNGDATVFLISLKAGGTGLNLTAADYVIHMDPWWNPAVEDQATDRAHRMGQTKPVMVYRMICENTIEEEILQLHDSKRDLIAGVLEGASQAGKLSTADLINLIKQS